MDVQRVEVRHSRSVEVGVVGPARGRPVLYFHSPATTGDELGEAASAAVANDLRLVSIRRPSIECDDPGDFVATVAADTESVVGALDLGRPTVVAWSGGAPYALAAAARLGPAIAGVHLVSPLPGPLTGPDAVRDPSPRLREVARSTSASPWIQGAAALRDYRAVAAPWPFALRSVTQDATIWSPTDDEIVPPRLVNLLARALPSATVVATTGTHAWLTDHWPTVLGRIGADAVG